MIRVVFPNLVTPAERRKSATVTVIRPEERLNLEKVFSSPAFRIPLKDVNFASAFYDKSAPLRVDGVSPSHCSSKVSAVLREDLRGWVGWPLWCVLAPVSVGGVAVKRAVSQGAYDPLPLLRRFVKGI